MSRLNGLTLPPKVQSALRYLGIDLNRLGRAALESVDPQKMARLPAHIQAQVVRACCPPPVNSYARRRVFYARTA